MNAHIMPSFSDCITAAVVRITKLKPNYLGCVVWFVLECCSRALVCTLLNLTRATHSSYRIWTLACNPAANCSTTERGYYARHILAAVVGAFMLRHAGFIRANSIASRVLYGNLHFMEIEHNHGVWLRCLFVDLAVKRKIIIRFRITIFILYCVVFPILFIFVSFITINYY